MTVIARYENNGVRYARVAGDSLFPLVGQFPDLQESGEPPVKLSSVKLLAPVQPSKIVAVGPNYRAHLNGNPPPPRPYFWIKPASVLLDPEGTIRLPPDAPMVCHESELAIVIGTTASKVSPEEAWQHIFGYTCINDVSAGQLTDMAAYFASQFFVDGKIYDSFGPLGPVIVTDIDPTNLRIQCKINGETRQDRRTSDQIWDPGALLSLISQRVTLYPGDVIATGSPPGPGPLADGDVVEITIEGIGTLRNNVAAA